MLRMKLLQSIDFSPLMFHTLPDTTLCCGERAVMVIDPPPMKGPRLVPKETYACQTHTCPGDVLHLGVHRSVSVCYCIAILSFVLWLIWTAYDHWLWQLSPLKHRWDLWTSQSPMVLDVYVFLVFFAQPFIMLKMSTVLNQCYMKFQFHISQCYFWSCGSHSCTSKIHYFWYFRSAHFHFFLPI